MTEINFKNEELFWEHYYTLDEETIIEINNRSFSGEFNNVIVGINRHCYSLMSIDEEKVEYQLAYINGDQLLQGDILKMSLNNPNRDEMVFYFSRLLTEKYDKLDIVDVFNTFQRFTQGYLEKIGFRTITSIEFEQLIDPTPVVFVKGRDIIPIQIIKKGEFYSKFMNENRINRDNFDSPQIYLILNAKNGNIKIGRSKNPSFREKTLQAEEPEIELISVWQAPKFVENELHKRFDNKRIRGEWFDLTFNDLKDIKNLMKKYE